MISVNRPLCVLAAGLILALVFVSAKASLTVDDGDHVPCTSLVRHNFLKENGAKESSLAMLIETE